MNATESSGAGPRHASLRLKGAHVLMIDADDRQWPHADIVIEDGRSVRASVGAGRVASEPRRRAHADATALRADMRAPLAASASASHKSSHDAARPATHDPAMVLKPAAEHVGMSPRLA